MDEIRPLTRVCALCSLQFFGTDGCVIGNLHLAYKKSRVLVGFLWAKKPSLLIPKVFF